ncbi:MAG TPA: helix-turn-helix domain-containing protein [Pseudomonas sabulinigri]|uniref:HTH cro/C1-type domain-containing protein n=1 Tax=marine sediment metagenome TaxID=412755 RepID=A0A0F9XX83_9ZZZZ|nr:helix-turn-helix domain-containing protein [Halopseudomonas sabulinigri]HEC50821.1 helix-turn-helix domain-containing protein [Halopseudomonas sabulinigri]
MTIAQQEKDFSVCSRLREERKALGLDQQDIAHALGVNLKTVGRWEKVIAIPSDKLAGLASLGFDVMYVLTGQRMPRPVEGLSERESVVLDNYRSLPEEDRVSVQRLTNALAESAARHSVDSKKSG